MRDVPRWLATATRSFAVDLAGSERRRAARNRVLTLLADLLVLSVLLLVVVGLVVGVGVAVGAAVADGGRIPELVAAWGLMFVALGSLPLVAMKVANGVYSRLHG